MATDDTCCSISPYFKVHEGKMDEFKAGCEAFVAKTREEPGALYYGYSFDGDMACCREGYKDAEALLAHVQNVGAMFQEVLKICDLVKFEIHGPESELAKLRGPLAQINAQYFVLECGFRR